MAALEGFDEDFVNALEEEREERLPTQEREGL